MLVLIMFFKMRDKISASRLIIVLELLEVAAAVILAISTLFESKTTFGLFAGLSRFLSGFGQGGITSINYSYIMLLYPQNI